VSEFWFPAVSNVYTPVPPALENESEYAVDDARRFTDVSSPETELNVAMLVLVGIPLDQLPVAPHSAELVLVQLSVVCPLTGTSTRHADTAAKRPRALVTRQPQATHLAVQGGPDLR
jgi:hypothetical protein